MEVGRKVDVPVLLSNRQAKLLTLTNAAFSNHIISSL